MDVFPGEVVERIEFPFPGPPIEPISPVGYEMPQPVLLGALFPADTGQLIGPSGLAKPHPQIVEDLIRNVNLKRLHFNTSLLAISAPDLRPDATDSAILMSSF
jgi:hypothetical protein